MQPGAKKRKSYCMIHILLWSSLILFILGLITPLCIVKTLWIFKDAVSIVSGLGTLWQSGSYGIFLLLLVFSVIFPFAKILLMFFMCYFSGLESKRLQALLRYSVALGKWSMLDVFVVAIFVVVAKAGVMANVKLYYGTYFFMLSIMLAIIASSMLHQQIELKADKQALIC